MEEIGKSLKTVFDKVSDFFDIFDLSFFVAGIGTGSALIYLYYLHNQGINLPFSSSFFRGLLVAIFFYLMGLISFALGRFFRLDLFRKKAYEIMNKRLIVAIKVHGLESKPEYSKYLNLPEGERGPWRLYVRLWAKLRDEPKLINSFTQAKRYWVMSATYDGVFISLCTWILTALYLLFINTNLISIDPLLGGITILFLTVSAIGCKLEAQRNLLNQVEEIIAIEANSSNT
jgi:hypothetical protein